MCMLSPARRLDIGAQTCGGVVDAASVPASATATIPASAGCADPAEPAEPASLPALVAFGEGGTVDTWPPAPPAAAPADGVGPAPATDPVPPVKGAGCCEPSVPHPPTRTPIALRQSRLANTIRPRATLATRVMARPRSQHRLEDLGIEKGLSRVLHKPAKHQLWMGFTAVECQFDA